MSANFNVDFSNTENIAKLTNHINAVTSKRHGKSYAYIRNGDIQSRHVKGAKEQKVGSKLTDITRLCKGAITKFEGKQLNNDEAKALGELMKAYDGLVKKKEAKYTTGWRGFFQKHINKNFNMQKLTEAYSAKLRAELGVREQVTAKAILSKISALSQQFSENPQQDEDLLRRNMADGFKELSHLITKWSEEAHHDPAEVENVKWMFNNLCVQSEVRPTDKSVKNYTMNYWDQPFDQLRAIKRLLDPITKDKSKLLETLATVDMDAKILELQLSHSGPFSEAHNDKITNLASSVHTGLITLKNLAEAHNLPALKNRVLAIKDFYKALHESALNTFNATEEIQKSKITMTSDTVIAKDMQNGTFAVGQTQHEHDPIWGKMAIFDLVYKNASGKSQTYLLSRNQEGVWKILDPTTKKELANAISFEKLLGVVESLEIAQNLIDQTNKAITERHNWPIPNEILRDFTEIETQLNFLENFVKNTPKKATSELTARLNNLDTSYTKLKNTAANITHAIQELKESEVTFSENVVDPNRMKPGEFLVGMQKLDKEFNPLQKEWYFFELHHKTQEGDIITLTISRNEEGEWNDFTNCPKEGTNEYYEFLTTLHANHSKSFKELFKKLKKENSMV